MKISSVISEFNPFHNGHKYLLKKTREETDAIICIMSGSFVQRGETAIYDKWCRAQAAVMNGADLVIELPAVFASATAERFAFGSVSLINALGCVNELSFGTESGDINELMNAALIMQTESEKVSQLIKKHLSAGESFPVARQKAFGNFINSDIISSPNNMLALEYIKAANKLHSSIDFKAIKRIGAAHDSINPFRAFSSASALRSILSESGSIARFIPDNLKNVYTSSDIYRFKNLDNIILYRLRSMDLNELKNISDVTEGLENRLKSASISAYDIQSLIDNVYSKRYSKARIRRIITAALLGIDKNIIQSKISYIRILAFNDIGRQILKEIKRKSKLPIITKLSDFKDKNPLLEKDILATDIASLCAENKKNRKAGKDYTRSPIYISM